MAQYPRSVRFPIGFRTGLRQYAPDSGKYRVGRLVLQRAAVHVDDAMGTACKKPICGEVVVPPIGN